MERDLLAHLLRAYPEQVAAPGESGGLAGSLMSHLIARLSDFPVILFSPSGQVLSQTRPAIALFGDHTRCGRSPHDLAERLLSGPAARPAAVDAVRVGVIDDDRPGRYWHPELGAVELYRQVLVDRVEHRTLLVFTAVAGSTSAEKLRLLAPGGD